MTHNSSLTDDGEEERKELNFLSCDRLHTWRKICQPKKELDEGFGHWTLRLVIVNGRKSTCHSTNQSNYSGDDGLTWD